TLPACAGRYDDEGVIYLRQRVVNVMQSGCRVVSQKREVFETPCARKPIATGIFDTHMPPHGCEHGVTAASRARRTSCCLLSSLYDIHVPERLFSFPHCRLHAASALGGWAMTFEEILDQAIAMLQRRRRVSYRALQRQFQLDDAYLQDLTVEIVEVLQLAVDQDNTMLVWTGAPSAPAPEAERRQLTVLFCDLAD